MGEFFEEVFRQATNAEGFCEEMSARGPSVSANRSSPDWKMKMLLQCQSKCKSLKHYRGSEVFLLMKFL